MVNFAMHECVAKGSAGDATRDYVAIWSPKTGAKREFQIGRVRGNTLLTQTERDSIMRIWQDVAQRDIVGNATQELCSVPGVGSFLACKVKLAVFELQTIDRIWRKLQQ